MFVELLTHDVSFAHMVLNATEAALLTRGNAAKIYDYKMDDCEKLLKNIIKLGHESVLEHIVLTYFIADISRALLQELARHRHISLSVESTRYVLRKIVDKLLADEACFYEFTENLSMPEINSLNHFLEIAKANPDMKNDELKRVLPEFFPTNLVLTLNIRELRHILKLRTAPQALKEFRDLALEMYHAIPEEFTYLVEDCVYHEEQQ